MKVVTIVRTRNEERNIGAFCDAYRDIADLILVADGGSEDRTLEIAGSYWPQVRILHFREQIVGLDNSLRNPEGAHVNFLIGAALDEGADWIIFDDCDCIPNYRLKEDARAALAAAEKHEPAIFVHRVYFWGRDQILPALHGHERAAHTGPKYYPAWTSLWAWRASTPIRADESDPNSPSMTVTIGGQDLETIRSKAKHLDFPYCLLHYAWPTPEIAQAKLARYRNSGQQPTAQHPLQFGGALAPPEDFMKPERP